MKPWFKNVKPYQDIQDGHLDESVFAADLAEVARGEGRQIYVNPETFFQKTYLTAGLKNIAKRVVQGLNGGQDADNRVISLQTGFGGGKTHTLISLFHLAKWGHKGTDSAHTKELFEYTGKPEFNFANIAVFTNTTNDPAQGRKVDGLTIRTIWGELAYQLGGKEAYEIIRPNDEMQVAPKGLFKQVLEKCKPALILIDELADYCISASAVRVEGSNLSDQTVSFMQELTEAVSKTDNCVMIATLPASAQELAASPISTQILTTLENRIARVGANVKPVEDDEIYEVVRRRLFEDLGDKADTENVISAYAALYQSLFTEIPDYALQTEYKEKLRKSYPFHPELIDMFRLRWASHPHFQRTRGVLRILAAIVSDLSKRQTSLTGQHALIHTSDVDFANIHALASQITILYGANWDAVINADIAGTASNAFHIDNQVKAFSDNSITQGIAATILLGTFGSQGQNKGVSLAELKLSMLKPESFNHNDINGALDKLEDVAHYLYYSTTGHKRYWFHTKPNINILINQAKNDVSRTEVEAEILKRLIDRSRTVQTFNVLVNPSDDVPEQQKLTLIILGPKFLASSDGINAKTQQVIARLATKKGNSERTYRNTILFLAASDIAMGKLSSDVSDYLACQKISTEYQSQLEKEQKDEIRRKIDDASKQVDSSLVAAYSVVIKHSVKNGFETLALKQFKESLDTQINSNLVSALKDEEWLLESVGLGTLRNNNLLPTETQPLKAKDVYEAFIRFDDKPMITGADAVARSLVKYCYEGSFCIATGDGKEFTKFYFKENVPFFDVQDSNYWLVDKSLKPAEATILPSEELSYESTISQTGAAIIEGREPAPEIDKNKVREFRSITISGKVPLERYTELFNYFITPFAMSGNKIEIQANFKISSTENSPLSESNQQYKNAKEAAKQLGLTFDEEIK